MKIKTIIVGVLQVNCYIAYDEASKECIVIDPGDDGDMICDAIDNLSLKPVMIVNTHYHFDHTGANRYVKNRYDIPIAIGKKDAPFLENAYKAALEFMIKSESSPKADILLSADDTIVFGNIIFGIIETPGHTKGSICLYNKENAVLFSGDTLFYESVGRWDLPGGNKNELFASLDKLFNLPSDTVVYPGHGPKTTIGYEINNNPYKKGVL